MFQPVCLAPFIVVKNGFNRSVKREMNRPKVAYRPISCCNPFLEVEVYDYIMAPS